MPQNPTRQMHALLGCVFRNPTRDYTELLSWQMFQIFSNYILRKVIVNYLGHYCPKDLAAQYGHSECVGRYLISLKGHVDIKRIYLVHDRKQPSLATMENKTVVLELLFHQDTRLEGLLRLIEDI